MNILVNRFVSDSKATGSDIYVDDVEVCSGLEDEFREVKIPGETRIPAGTYKVALRTEGTHHQRYAKKFPEFHKGMLHILDVPKFKWILIHIGNFETDTDGCLLVGEQLLLGPPMSLRGSTTAYIRLYKMVVEAAAAGDLTITYEDNDI